MVEQEAKHAPIAKVIKKVIERHDLRQNISNLTGEPVNVST